MPLHISLVSKDIQADITFETDQFLVYIVIEDAKQAYLSRQNTDEVSKAQKKCILLGVVHLGGGGGGGDGGGGGSNGKKKGRRITHLISILLDVLIPSLLYFMCQCEIIMVQKYD